jgi:hypothetical protein
MSNTCGGQVGFENVSPSAGAAPGLYLVQASLPPEESCAIVANVTGSASAANAGGNASVEVTANAREGGASTPTRALLEIVPAPTRLLPTLASASASPTRVRVGKRVTVAFTVKDLNPATPLSGLGLSSRVPRGLAFAPLIRSSLNKGLLQQRAGVGSAPAVRILRG